MSNICKVLYMQCKQIGMLSYLGKNLKFSLLSSNLFHLRWSFFGLNWIDATFYLCATTPQVRASRFLLLSSPLVRSVSNLLAREHLMEEFDSYLMVFPILPSNVYH
jgi:hypothetical protein